MSIHKIYIALLISISIPKSGFCAEIFTSDDAFQRDLMGAQVSIKEKIHKSRVKNLNVDEIDNDAIYELVISQLKDSGIPNSYVKHLINSPKTHVVQDVIDGFNPKSGKSAEDLTYEEYRAKHLTKARIDRGVQFYKDNRILLDAVAERFHADPLILVSLVGIETFYGTPSQTGHIPVFNAFYTVMHSIPRKRDWASFEMAEYLKLAYKHFKAHSVLGSYAGAFGYGQFLPSSFNEFAVDFDMDGKRTWDEWPDVLGSVANYLVKHGYEGSDLSQDSPIWNSLFAYNHSNNYVRLILDLRQEIIKKLDEPATGSSSTAPR